MAGPPLYRGWLPRGWDLEITYKPIRNIWFRVDPHRQCFRISAPSGLGSDTLNRAIRAKADWMASRADVPAPLPLIPKQLHSGDTCLVHGHLHTVGIRPGAVQNRVALAETSQVIIHVKGQKIIPEHCAGILADWYRQLLTREIARLVPVWEPRLGVRVNECRLRKMKTRWGSCNTRAKRVWINLALACLESDLTEYVLVHEMVHLLEPSHNKRFYGFMDQFLPDWQDRKSRLSSHGPGLS